MYLFVFFGNDAFPTSVFIWMRAYRPKRRQLLEGLREPKRAVSAQ